MHSITRFGHLDSSSGHSFTLFALRAVVASSCIVVVDAGGDWGGGWDGARSHPMVSAEEIHISAEGIERLSCSTRDGTLSVVGKPGGEASFVVVEKRAWGDTEADAAQNLAKIKVTHELRGDRVLLGWEWSGSRPRWAPAFVCFRVEVPATVAADLSARNGNLSLRGLAGEISGKTENGNIEAWGSANAVRLASTNGNITVGLDGTGVLAGNIETENGNVTVGLSGAYSTLVIASSENGDVQHESGLEEVHKNRPLLVGESLGGEGRLRGHSENGSVVIR